MMRLEHLNLVVRDMQETLRFYQAAFPHWRVRDQGEGEWYGTERTWLHFGDDYNYLSLNDSGYGDNRNLQSNVLGLSHLGFITSNLDAVISRLLAEGFEISHEGAHNAHRRNVYFIDPNGFEVEFIEYLSDIPAERNS